MASIVKSFPRGRLRHNRHFTFKAAGDTAVTLVTAQVGGALASTSAPLVAKGPWLQILVDPDWLAQLETDLAGLQQPDSVSISAPILATKDFFFVNYFFFLRFVCLLPVGVAQDVVFWRAADGVDCRSGRLNQRRKKKKKNLFFSFLFFSLSLFLFFFFLLPLLDCTTATTCLYFDYPRDFASFDGRLLPRPCRCNNNVRIIFYFFADFFFFFQFIFGRACASSERVWAGDG